MLRFWDVPLGRTRNDRNFGDIIVQSISYLQTETLLRALEFATSKGGFGTNARQKKTALALIKSMKSNESVSGRHQQLSAMLKKGATIGEMIKATGASRRTIFRYLNHFEDAGLDIAIADGKYKLK